LARVGGAPVLTVNDDGTVVAARLAAGGLACPSCGGVLAGWGWARPRWLRLLEGRRLVRPRRTRCAGCAVTHVLLPVEMLARRADGADVVGKALVAKASGRGARPIAVALARPLGTVRGWLRAFAVKAELLRSWFIQLLVAVAPDPVVPDAVGTVFADAVAAIAAASIAVADRFAVRMVTPWPIASAASQGSLLSPGWPAKPINTSSPWLATV
jgi:hypothetical protein